MTYNRKIMRLELSAEKALNGGYYYAELLLPAADYEIKDANGEAAEVSSDRRQKQPYVMVRTAVHQRRRLHGAYRKTQIQTRR